MKRIPKRHKPWCAIHLPSIGRCDCWYDDDGDDGSRKPRPKRPKLLAGGGAPAKRTREMEDA